MDNKTQGNDATLRLNWVVVTISSVTLNREAHGSVLLGGLWLGSEPYGSYCCATVSDLSAT